MKYNELSPQEYFQRIKTVIVGAEGLHAHSQDVGDKMATIGWGYTFNRDDNMRIWKESGIDLSRGQWAALAEIDAAPKADKTRLGLAFDRTLSRSESDQLLRATLRDYERPADSLRMPLSDERVALVSLAYNRGVPQLMGSQSRPEHPVMQAIRGGDRAEAWYQIRYNCWGSNPEAEGGLRKRRFAEAQVFGLYDDPKHVSTDEARGVLAMVGRHRTEIDRVEARFGDLEGPAVGRPNRIAQANRDYPALVAEYGAVPTLERALASARAALPRIAHDDRGSAIAPSGQATGPERADVRVPLLEQAERAVRQLDESLGRKYDSNSACMAASLACLAKQNGFDCIDHVVLSTDGPNTRAGQNVFVVQGDLDDPAKRRAHMATSEAIAAPVEQSLARLQAMSEGTVTSQVQSQAEDLQQRQVRSQTV